MSAHEPPFVSSPHAKSWPWWTLLVLLCSLIFAVNFIEKTAPATLPDPAKIDSPILKLYGRYMMGANNLMQWAAPSQVSSPKPQALLDPIDDAAPTIIEKLRVVPLAAELVGPAAALERLDTIDTELASDPSLDEAFRRDAATLRAIYTDNESSLDQSQRDELTTRHLWFARLALSFGKPDTDPDRQAFASEATRAMTAIIALFFLIAIAGFAGFVLFIIAAVLLGTGKLSSAFSSPPSGTGVPPVSPPLSSSQLPLPLGGGGESSSRGRDTTDQHRASPLSASNSFLETFVLFLASFLAASAAAEVAHSLTGLDLSFILFWIIPALALWPLSRGLSWPQLRKNIGWHRGQGIPKEIAAGFVGYLTGLPIIILGVVLSILIITLTGTDSSHPIVNEVSSGGTFALITLFLMTTLWAPLVEESFFRGALYSHLRGLPLPSSPIASMGEDRGEGSASSAFPTSSTPFSSETAAPTLSPHHPLTPSPHHPRRALSIIPAALITGFIFAVIHPQGFGGIPILTALGFNFCLLREWRGSLIAPMTAHALHNGVATLALVMFLA